MVKFNRYKDGKLRALTMSYDDGKDQDIRLVEIFNKYGIKATFHINANKLQHMTDEELRERGKVYVGHEVSCHAYHHPHLSPMPKQVCTKEMIDDRILLEKMCGYPIRGMSYPYGIYTDDVIAASKAAGMEYSRTAVSTKRFDIPNDFMQWHGTCHHNDNLEELLYKFNGSWVMMPIFYIYGHSFEFDHDNNWDMIESFCKKASGNPMTWYATNIEIVDYVNAVKQLRFTWDRRAVYNPSAVDVWVEVGGEPIKIPSGKTVDLGEEATK